MAGEAGSYDLERFLRAQDSGGVFAQALAELRAGQKTSHWIWFVFPQLEGLGRSETARYYAISSIEEARGFLAHEVLGRRLEEACTALLESPSSDPVAVLGHIDALKLRSSLTLFMRADPTRAVFPAVLDRFYGGEIDEATEELLSS